jgi:hypothetical protein
MELARSVMDRLARRPMPSKTACLLGWIQENQLALSRASRAGSIFEHFSVVKVARKASPPIVTHEGEFGSATVFVF